MAVTAIATTTNNNHRHAGEVPEHLQYFIIKEVVDAVQVAADNCLHFRVQCVNVDEAAKLLGVFPDTIRQYIKRSNNSLKASKPGKDYIIRLVDLHNFLINTQVQTTVVFINRKRKF